MSTTLAMAIFLVASGTLSLGAVALAVRESRFRQRAAPALGVIRARHVGSAPNSCGAVTVTVEFEDVTGATRRATAPVVTGTRLAWRRRGGPEVKLLGPPDYPVGDSLPILYDPERPENVRVDTWLDRWLWV